SLGPSRATVRANQNAANIDGCLPNARKNPRASFQEISSNIQAPSTSETPSTKSQIPNSKSQTSILGPSFGICNFGIFLGFGFWDLGFGPWCSRGFPWIFLRNPTGETFLPCPDYTPSASLLRSL